MTTGGNEAPRIVGIAPGDPFARATWSGVSHHLFGALRGHEALLDAVGVSEPAGVGPPAKALSVHPRRQTWVERYEYSPLRRAVRNRLATRAVSRTAHEPYETLQIGAWYELSPRLRQAPRLRCSFHDNNLVLYAREGDFVADPGAPHIRREMAVERGIYDRLDLIFVMSEWLRRSFLSDQGQDPEKVLTVGSGVNSKRLPRELPRRSFDVPRLLFVGLDFERKGGPAVLDAFARLRAAHPDAELTIVGPEPRGRHPGVTWAGRIDRSTESGDAEMDRLHREATGFVMPSRSDPMPNAFLEAMAYGLPCVGSRCGGIPEMVVDGETGRIVEIGDVEALSGALALLAGDPEQARRLGEAGRTRVLERFTWERVTARMLEHIQARVASSRRRAAP